LVNGIKDNCNIQQEVTVTHICERMVEVVIYNNLIIYWQI
jgi:hypothetical protein